MPFLVCRCHINISISLDEVLFKWVFSLVTQGRRNVFGSFFLNVEKRQVA